MYDKTTRSDLKKLAVINKLSTNNYTDNQLTALLVLP